MVFSPKPCFCRFCVTFEFKTKLVFQNFIFGPQTMVFLVLCTQLTPFKTIWPDFIFVYPIDSFQDHLTQFYHYIPNWLLSRPFDLIYVLSTQLIPFKTIWLNFIIVYPIDSFKTIWPEFYHCVPNWLLSRPFDLNFIIVYLIDSFQDHLTWFYHCLPNWLLSRPLYPILSLCTQLTPFKTIWPDFTL